MECLNCRSDNRPGRRFCGSCGLALPMMCEACGFFNDPDDNFCGGCSIAVSARVLSTSDQPEGKKPGVKGRTYAFEGARRQLTVMFCDLVGSTEISEQLDPEEMTGLLTAYRIACSEVVDRFGGFIGNFMGDGLLIYFGYPQAHEDDPQRAIRAGLSIISAVEELNSDFPRQDVVLNVRIGINTGLVVAADIGSGEQREKMAIVGDTPNIAARLQGLAEPGTVVIGKRTHRLIEGLFICEPLGARLLKGMSDPIEVFLVRDTTEARTSFEAKLQRGLTPLAGRTEEVGLLVNRWDQAREGDGQVVLISGEPGVGKSRVLQGFRSIVSQENGPILTLLCSNYQQDTPFHPLIDYLERAVGNGADGAPEKMLDNLDAILMDLGLAVKEHGGLLAQLLSLPSYGRYGDVPLTLEEQKNRTMKALVALVDGMARKSATLIIVEDLQWADYSTLEFLGLLIEQTRVSPILIVLAHRAGFEPPWIRNPHVTKLRLRHLSRTESIELVNALTGGRALPVEVLEHILSRTDGVPLFIEELTKLVLEMGILRARENRFELLRPLGSTVIPESLQDSLMARLDRLSSAKDVAQLASVLGRNFTHALLLAVTDKSEAALEQALARLVEAELLYRRGLAPEVVYEFKHALVKDAAYQGLLHSKRRQLHKEIAQTLENRFPQITDRSPELLSHHYFEAGDMQKAVPYSFKAGDDAAGRYASTEASAHYQSALDMAKGIATPGDADGCQIKAILKLANVATSREQFERNLGNLGMARTLAEKSDNRVRLCQIQYWTGRTYYVQGRFGLAADLARQALDIAETIDGDDRIRSGPVNLLARVHCLLGEPVAAIGYATESVRQMHDSGDHMEEAAVSGVLAFAHAQHGQFDEALLAANHGVSLAQQIGHLPTIAACLMFRGLVHGWFGRLKEATPDFDQGLHVCEQSGDVFRKYLTLGWRGEACLIAGEIGAARSSLEQCLSLGTTLGTAFHRGAFEAFLAKAILAQGKPDEAFRVSDAAVASATQSGEIWPRSIALRVASEVQLTLHEPDLDLACEAISNAIEIQKERQCRCDLAWSCLVQGRVLLARGQVTSAKAALDAARLLFLRLGLQPGLQFAQSELARLDEVDMSAG